MTRCTPAGLLSDSCECAERGASGGGAVAGAGAVDAASLRLELAIGDEAASVALFPAIEFVAISASSKALAAAGSGVIAGDLEGVERTTEPLAGSATATATVPETVPLSFNTEDNGTS